jgi:hypothetical protein
MFNVTAALPEGFMSRLITVIGAAVASVALASAAGAADFPMTPGLRTGFPTDWSAQAKTDPLTFEAGLRYWYSMGSQSTSLGGGKYTSNDKTHILEAHLRIDDHSTNTFLTANAGYSFAISGDYNANGVQDTVAGGQVGYAGADFGWMPFGSPDNGVGLGGLIGYQYWNDSPDMGRGTFYNISSVNDVSWSSTTGAYSVSGNSQSNNLNINMLRLGLTARANLGPMDIDAQLAGIPFAKVNGVLGAASFPTYSNGGVDYYPSSPVALDGYAYGAAGQIMIGFHPTEHMTFRIGARAQYLTGSTDATYTVAGVTPPAFNGTNYDPPTVSTQSYIQKNTPFSILRYGALAEASWTF